MFETILVAYDGSEQSRRAFAVALDLAKCGGGRLHLVSVIEKLPRYAEETMNGVDEIVEQARAHYEELQQSAEEAASAAGVRLTRHVVPGHPVEEIVHLADSERADLVVLGGFGHSRKFRRSSGGTGSQIAYHASCSVLLVR